MQQPIRTSIPKLHSVRWKSGGTLVPVNTPKCDLRWMAEKTIRDVIKGPGVPIAGFALVAWQADYTSIAVCKVGGASSIPTILVPDFVRNRLLAQRIEAWTIDTINGD